MSLIEVLSGPERRRRWSAEQKLEIVRASFEPDVTIAEVARRFDVTRQQIYQWRSDCRSGHYQRTVLSADFYPALPPDGYLRAEEACLFGYSFHPTAPWLRLRVVCIALVSGG